MVESSAPTSRSSSSHCWLCVHVCAALDGWHVRGVRSYREGTDRPHLSTTTLLCPPAHPPHASHATPSPPPPSLHDANARTFFHCTPCASAAATRASAAFTISSSRCTCRCYISPPDTHMDGWMRVDRFNFPWSAAPQSPHTSAACAAFRASPSRATITSISRAEYCGTCSPPGTSYFMLSPAESRRWLMEAAPSPSVAVALLLLPVPAAATVAVRLRVSGGSPIDSPSLWTLRYTHVRTHLPTAAPPPSPPAPRPPPTWPPRARGCRFRRCCSCCCYRRPRFPCRLLLLILCVGGGIIGRWSIEVIF